MGGRHKELLFCCYMRRLLVSKLCLSSYHSQPSIHHSHLRASLPPPLHPLPNPPPPPLSLPPPLPLLLNPPHLPPPLLQERPHHRRRHLLQTPLPNPPFSPHSLTTYISPRSPNPTQPPNPPTLKPPPRKCSGAPSTAKPPSYITDTTPAPPSCTRPSSPKSNITATASSKAAPLPSPVGTRSAAQRVSTGGASISAAGTGAGAAFLEWE